MAVLFSPDARREGLRLVFAKSLRFGRYAEGPDLAVDDPLLSRNHGEFRVDPNGARVAIVDLGSLNGTSRNGVPIAKRALIRSGDLIRAGDTILHYRSVRRGLKGSIIASTTRPRARDVAARRASPRLAKLVRGSALHGPPLRERRDDILLILRHFLQSLGRRFDFTADFAERVVLQSWPGNVRQLEQFAKRLAERLADGTALESGHASWAFETE